MQHQDPKYQIYFQVLVQEGAMVQVEVKGEDWVIQEDMRVKYMILFLFQDKYRHLFLIVLNPQRVS
jgi:hypothetical protein